MEMIDCMQGTNMTEAYHKNLLQSFFGWHTGVEMSTTTNLLAEQRHRGNHQCSEIRREGFPKIGHYNTWLIDQLQNLVMQNRGWRIFPNWYNASDYKITEETFDTIALHSVQLHEVLMTQWESIPHKADIKLTSDQKYICRAMGTKLPFLPFATDEERNKLHCAYWTLISPRRKILLPLRGANM